QELTNFDVFATAGAMFKAVVEEFSVTADSNGVLTVNFIPVTGYGQINGIEVMSGGSDVLALNAGELAGGTLTVNPATFINQGTLQVSNGEALNISGFSGNVGTATLSGPGSSLTLTGVSYTVNQGLTATAAEVLTLNAGWTNAAGSTISATGATLNLGNSSTAWSNAGTI